MVARNCNDCHSNPHTPGSTVPNPKEIFYRDVDECGRCHDQKDFKDAEFTRVQHADIGVSLEGRHSKAKCSQCHTKERALSIRHPESREAMNRCSDCHANPHQPPVLGTPDGSLHFRRSDACKQCHGVEQFKPVEARGLDHASFGYPLLGAHKKSECRDCHAAKSPDKWPAQGDPPAAQHCAACHRNPHGPAFLESVAEERKLSSADTCSACHNARDGIFRWPEAKMPKELHAATGFTLGIAHKDVECSKCHKNLDRTSLAKLILPLTSQPWKDRYPGRSAKDCKTCHEDPHGGQFRAKSEEDSCLKCHAETHFAPSDFDLEEHAAAGYPLIASHQAVACHDCHLEKLLPGHEKKTRIFRGTSRVCSDCHGDVHAGAFDKKEHPKVLEGRDGCARCHKVAGFRELQQGSFDHKFWTGFALQGAHKRAQCINCHPRTPEKDENGRHFAKAAKRCDACHEDIHAGQFREGKKNDCTKCHEIEEKGFKASKFDHSRDSRFKLDKHHKELDCASCHKPVTFGRLEIVRYKPLGTKCADCHDTRILKGKRQSRNRRGRR